MKKFKAGDIVYHKNLQKCGIFAEYDWLTDTECHVEFIDEDGYKECKHVTVSQLEYANDGCGWVDVLPPNERLQELFTNGGTYAEDKEIQ